MAGNTPVPDVVDAPTIGTATAGAEEATVTFTAATTGGAATTFGAISTPGSVTGTSATSPITVSGLTGGTAYTFKTYGINSSGTWNNVLSAASNSVTPTVPTSFESIATVLVGSGGSATVTFTSIPATYTHLQIRAIAKSNGGADSLDLNFNGDFGSSQYTYHSMYGNGSNMGVDVSRPRATIPTDINLVASSNTSMFSAGVLDILDYANVNKYTTTRVLSGFNTNGSANGTAVFFSSGLWMSTSAVTSITLTGRSTNIGQYSSFALYGIKGV